MYLSRNGLDVKMSWTIISARGTALRSSYRERPLNILMWLRRMEADHEGTVVRKGCQSIIPSFLSINSIGRRWQQ